jgi:hypothetical protein
MKLTLLLLVLCLQAAAQLPPLPPASDPWWHSHTGKAFVARIEAYQEQLAADLKTNNQQFETLMSRFQATTLRIQTYNACRVNLRWYQVWKKRCKL